MNGNNKNMEVKQLKFNTYCILKREKQEVKEIIGVIFKDYLENLKIE